jgi:hypoxanthine phosphoribosyltransferase
MTKVLAPNQSGGNYRCGETEQLTKALANIGKRLDDIMVGSPCSEVPSKTKKVKLTEPAIQHRANEIALLLRREYAGQDLTLLSVQTGANIWAGYIAKELATFNRIPFMDKNGQSLEPVALRFDDVKVKTYSGTERASQPTFIHEPNSQLIRNCHVLVLEDIVDSGATVEFLRKTLTEDHGAKSVKVCAMLDKPSGRDDPDDPKPDCCGYEIGPDFVVGMGLDVDEYGRDLPAVHRVVDL